MIRILSFLVGCATVACSGDVAKISDAASDAPGSDGGSMTDGSTNDSSADSGSDGSKDAGPGTCPSCNDGFACCMVMSSANYMKCAAKACLACCM
jgi:hypothetical protein